MASDIVVTQGEAMASIHLHFQVTRLDRVRMWLGMRLLAIAIFILGVSGSVEVVDEPTGGTEA